MKNIDFCDGKLDNDHEYLIGKSRRNGGMNFTRTNEK